MGRFVPMLNTMAQRAHNSKLEAVHEFPLSLLPALSSGFHTLSHTVHALFSVTSMDSSLSAMFLFLFHVSDLFLSQHHYMPLKLC